MGPLFKNEKILKVGDIFKISCLKFYYRLINNMLPVNLSRLFNFSNNDRFKLNHFDCQDSKGKHRIRYYLPKLIQETDLQILNKTRCFAMLGFKSYTKKYILSNY